MNRDFAYKGKAGKGVIQSLSKKKSITWGWQVLLVLLVCIAVVVVFTLLSTGRRESVIDPAISHTQIQQPIEQEETQQKLIDRQQTKKIQIEKQPQIEIKKEQQTINTRVFEDITTDTSPDLEFYQLLAKPLVDDYNPDIKPNDKIIYRVQSGLIRHKVNARSLKALLVFEGFHHTRISGVQWNNDQWYQLVIEPISSRSRMNAARDFLGGHDLDSSYKKIR